MIVAAIPETCGHDIEVPERKLNRDGFCPAGASEVSLVPNHAAKMFTPGAAMSGYMHAQPNSCHSLICLFIAKDAY